MERSPSPRNTETQEHNATTPLSSDRAMHYTFRYSTPLKVYTALCVMVLGLICYYAFRSSPWLMIVLYSWMIFISLLYSALSMPRSIEDDGETVVLRRLLWSKRYSRTTYDISEVSGMELTKSYAIVGSAGYFCYGGHRPLPTHPAQGQQTPTLHRLPAYPILLITSSHSPQHHTFHKTLITPHPIPHHQNGVLAQSNTITSI